MNVTTATPAAPAIALDSSLADRWIAYLDTSPSTVRTYTRGIRLFLRWLAARGVTTPSREDVLAYRADVAATHKPTTATNYLAAVKLFFRWLAQEGLYANIADRIKSLRLDRDHKRDYLLEGQVRRVLEGIDRSTVGGLRDYAMIALMVTTGLRTVSVSLADVGDLRPAGASMALYYQGKGHAEKARYVKVAPAVEDALRAYLAARGTVAGDSPLFASVSNHNSAGRLATASVSRICKGAMRRVNLTSSTLVAHSLRHTAATLNLLAGGTLAETQQLLDHSNINTTMIYSHALTRAQNDSENRIARSIFG